MYFMPKEKTYKISPNVTVIQFFTSNKNEIDLGSKEQNLIRIKEVEKTRIKYKIDITISFLYSPNIIISLLKERIIQDFTIMLMQVAIALKYYRKGMIPKEKEKIILKKWPYVTKKLIKLCFKVII